MIEKDSQIKVQSKAGRLYVEVEDVLNSSKGKELINKAKNSTIYKEIISKKERSAA
jgi:hypothetical protein